MLRVTASRIAGLIATILIPVVCLGASMWGWRQGGSRLRLVTSTLAGVVVACAAFALIGRAVDVEPFTMTFIILTVGLAAGSVLVGKKRLHLT